MKSRSIAIMQPYLFPYLGYFQLIRAVDTFILYDNLKYIKYGWVNRNRLLGVKHLPFYFVIPVPKKNLSKKTIREIQIKDQKWRQKLLKSIHFNYNKSSFFDETLSLLENIIFCPTDSLSAFNKKSIIAIAEYLEIKTDILAEPEFDDLEAALRTATANLEAAFPTVKLETPTIKVIRPIMICQMLHANTFINPIGGINLYPKDEFLRNHIKVWFLQMSDVSYPQNAADFFPNLSIIDVLMNCGREGTSRLLEQYSLV